MTYLNTFSSTATLTAEAEYELADDLAEFVVAHHRGKQASISAEGVREALEDGEVLRTLTAELRSDLVGPLYVASDDEDARWDDEMRAIAEELHDVLVTAVS